VSQEPQHGIAGDGPLGGLAEQYHLLMECVTDYAIFLIDRNGLIVAWNAGARRMFQYEASEILGQSFSVFFPTEDRLRGDPEKELRKAELEGQATDDRWHIRKDGSRFWVSGVSTALRDEIGALRGFAKVTRDRTEQRRFEQELKQQATELAASDRRKDEVLAILGHELRNLLTPIRNSCNVLRLTQLDPKVQQAREMIDRQVNHMTRLVEDLLDVARIRQGKVQLKKERLELASVLAHAVEVSIGQIEARRHQFRATVPPAPIWLEADRTRLVQVIGNLLSNAAKYTPPGGQIELIVEHGDKNDVLIRVRDNGIGIPREMLANVFDLFAQVDNPAQEGQEGLGIGLSLVHSLVVLHDGAVRAESAGPGKGSEFIVQLPAMSAPVETPAAEMNSPREGALPTSSRRVLVVDDSHDAAESLGTLLRLMGHEVMLAHDGPQAIQLARTDKPEVVFLDLQLPGMDGLDVARMLREMYQTPLILVAITGHGAAEHRNRAREAGFDYYLVKPLEPDELQQYLTHPGGE
jgi:PAS domain S-box-containing protein